ncbi:hypothetical protein ACIQNU_39645, partial [Streptomyces sp. NPDC091292]
MEDADSVLGDIKVEEMYALGNAWIQLGDALHERRVAVNGHVDGIGMTGAAGDEARRAWEEGLAPTFDATAEKAWTIGQTINRYADELYKAAEEYAEQLNAAMWADILGVIFGLVLIGLGPILARVMSIISSLLARLIPVVTAIGSRLGTVGGAVVGAAGGAVAGAAVEAGLDIGIGALGAEIAGADFDVTWSVAISAIVGAGFGAHGGGLMGWHYGSGGRSFVPKPTPVGDAPSSVPPGVTPSTVKPMPGSGDGTVPPPSRTPGGDLSLPTPDGLGRGDGSLAPPPSGGRDGVSVKENTPTNSGPGNGRSGDLGMPAQATKTDGSSTAPPPTPLPARGNSGTTETPGSAPRPGPSGRDSVSPPAPQPPVTTHPIGSGDGTGVAPPGGKRPDGPPVAPDSRVTPDSQPGGTPPRNHGSDSPAPSSIRPTGNPDGSNVTGSGNRFGGPTRDLHGQTSPRPEGSSRSVGSDMSAAPRPATRSGPDYDQPAKLDNPPGGKQSGGGKGSDAGEGGLRSSNGGGDVGRLPTSSRPQSSGRTFSPDEAGQGLARHAESRGMSPGEARKWGDQFADARRIGDSVAEQRVQADVHRRLGDIDAERVGKGTVEESPAGEGGLRSSEGGGDVGRLPTSSGPQSSGRTFSPDEAGQGLARHAESRGMSPGEA